MTTIIFQHHFQMRPSANVILRFNFIHGHNGGLLGELGRWWFWAWGWGGGTPQAVSGGLGYLLISIAAPLLRGNVCQVNVRVYCGLDLFATYQCKCCVTCIG